MLKQTCYFKNQQVINPETTLSPPKAALLKFAKLKIGLCLMVSFLSAVDTSKSCKKNFCLCEYKLNLIYLKQLKILKWFRCDVFCYAFQEKQFCPKAFIK